MFYFILLKLMLGFTFPQLWKLTQTRFDGTHITKCCCLYCMVLHPLSEKWHNKKKYGTGFSHFWRACWLETFLSESVDAVHFAEYGNLECAVCCRTSATDPLAGWQVAVNNVLCFTLSVFLKEQARKDAAWCIDCITNIRKAKTKSKPFTGVLAIYMRS